MELTRFGVVLLGIVHGLDKKKDSPLKKKKKRIK